MNSKHSAEEGNLRDMVSQQDTRGDHPNVELDKDDLSQLVAAGSSDELRSRHVGGEIDLSGLEVDSPSVTASLRIDLSELEVKASASDLSHRVEHDVHRLAMDGQEDRAPVLVPAKWYRVLTHEVAEQSRFRTELTVALSGVGVIRLVGYLLMLIFAVDIALTLYPLNTFDPAWELGVIEGVADSLLIPLLGLALVFWGGSFERTRLDLFLLWLLSWGSLVIGLLLLALIPLSLVDSGRLQSELEQDTAAQLETQESLYKQAVSEVTQIGSIGELRAHIEAASGQAVSVRSDGNLEDVRHSVLERLKENWSRSREQLITSEQERSTDTSKRLAKLVVSLSLEVLFLLYLWRSSVWARDTWREIQQQEPD